MSHEDRDNLQPIIDRMLGGDNTARRDLLANACHRLQRLAGTMLHGSFPVLRGRHELDSIVHETWLRLEKSLRDVNPPTVADFLRLAAYKMRLVLLDMVTSFRDERARERLGLGNSSFGEEALHQRNDTYNPSRLTEWTEFHQKVADLPEDERNVFEMHYYLGLKQVEIAKLIGKHPNRVSILWISARERLADSIDFSQPSE